MKTLKTIAAAAALTTVAAVVWAQMDHGSYGKEGGFGSVVLKRVAP